MSPCKKTFVTLYRDNNASVGGKNYKDTKIIGEKQANASLFFNMQFFNALLLWGLVLVYVNEIFSFKVISLFCL